MCTVRQALQIGNGPSAEGGDSRGRSKGRLHFMQRLRTHGSGVALNADLQMRIVPCPPVKKVNGVPSGICCNVIHGNCGVSMNRRLKVMGVSRCR